MNRCQAKLSVGAVTYEDEGAVPGAPIIMKLTADCKREHGHDGKHFTELAGGEFEWDDDDPKCIKPPKELTPEECDDAIDKLAKAVE